MLGLRPVPCKLPVILRPEEVGRQMSRYPVEAEIQVRYDPREPQTAIEPGTYPSIAEEMRDAFRWLGINGGIAHLLVGFSIRRIVQRWDPSPAGAVSGDDLNHLRSTH